MIDKIKNIIISCFAGVFALFLIYLRGKNTGKQEEKQRTNEKILDDLAKIKSNTNADNLARVHDKYTKR